MEVAYNGDIPIVGWFISWHLMENPKITWLVWDHHHFRKPLNVALTWLLHVASCSPAWDFSENHEAPWFSWMIFIDISMKWMAIWSVSPSAPPGVLFSKALHVGVSIHATKKWRSPGKLMDHYPKGFVSIGSWDTNRLPIIASCIMLGKSSTFISFPNQ